MPNHTKPYQNISWFPAVVKNIWLFLFRVGLGKPSSSLSLRSPSSSSLSLRRPSCYDKKTAWHSLPVSCNTILCTKLERHIECTRVVRFWFSCMWQLKSIIVWCFTWFQNRENVFARFSNAYFGAFCQSPQRTRQYWKIQNKHSFSC